MLTPTRPASGAPMLIGEHPALDFLNSTLAPHGETLDYLYDGDTLRAWLGTSRVLPEFMVQALAHFSPAQRTQLANDARDLREAFRRILVQRHAAKATDEVSKDLDYINTWLSRGPLIVAPLPAEHGWQLALRRDPSTLAAVLAELAAVCADLLVNYAPEQVRRCENPACTLWFHDHKRGPRRRWCSMAICGNRMKVAAHRARRKT